MAERCAPCQITSGCRNPNLPQESSDVTHRPDVHNQYLLSARARQFANCICINTWLFPIDRAELVIAWALHSRLLQRLRNNVLPKYLYTCTHTTIYIPHLSFHSRAHTQARAQTKHQQCPKVNGLHSPPVTRSGQANISASPWQTHCGPVLFVCGTPGGRRKHAFELCLGRATMWTC